MARPIRPCSIVPTLVVVGSITTDMVVRAPQLPRAGETVLGGDFRQLAGAAVAMVGCVGDDQRGRDAVVGLRQEGVEVSQIQPLSEAASGVALIVVDARGQNCIAVASGANACLTPAMIRHAESLLAAADVVLVQLEIPLDAVVATATIASGHGARVILDPAPAQALPDALWRRLALMTPNVTEAAALTGLEIRDQEDARVAAGVLLERGVESVIVTLGADGVLVDTRQARTVIEGLAVEAINTTAAGDTFAGARGSISPRVMKTVFIRDVVRFGRSLVHPDASQKCGEPVVPAGNRASRAGQLEEIRADRGLDDGRHQAEIRFAETCDRPGAARRDVDARHVKHRHRKPVGVEARRGCDFERRPSIRLFHLADPARQVGLDASPAAVEIEYDELGVLGVPWDSGQPELGHSHRRLGELFDPVVGCVVMQG